MRKRTILLGILRTPIRPLWHPELTRNEPGKEMGLAKVNELEFRPRGIAPKFKSRNLRKRIVNKKKRLEEKKGSAHI